MNPEKWGVLLETLQQDFTQENIEWTKWYVRMLKQYAPPDKYSKLLNIGVGEGPQEIELLTKEGYDVLGITIQGWMENKNISLMDMHDQLFKPNSFDVVYSTQVFEHSYAPWLLLMETWITLRPGGILFITMPYKGEHQSIHHPSDLSIEEWNFIVKEVGFKDIFSANTTMEESITFIISEKSEPNNIQIKEALTRLTEIRNVNLS